VALPGLALPVREPSEGGGHLCLEVCRWLVLPVYRGGLLCGTGLAIGVRLQDQTLEEMAEIILRAGGKLLDLDACLRETHLSPCAVCGSEQGEHTFKTCPPCLRLPTRERHGEGSVFDLSGSPVDVSLLASTHTPCATRKARLRRAKHVAHCEARRPLRPLEAHASGYGRPWDAAWIASDTESVGTGCNVTMLQAFHNLFIAWSDDNGDVGDGGDAATIAVTCRSNRCALGWLITIC